ncbi:MAG: hypothetical protein AAF663_05570, partial [Planctomycetota bacterium]
MPVIASSIAASPNASELAALRAVLPPLGDGRPAVSVQSSFQTSISLADSGAETRRAQRSRPRLRIAHPVADDTRWLLDGVLARSTASRFLMPLASDAVQLASTASSGQAALVSVDAFAVRRFEAGAKFVVYAGGEATDDFEVGVVQSISGGSGGTITATANLASAWSAGSWAVPLVECELSPASQLGLTRWDDATASIEFNATVGPQLYSPLADPGTLPTGYDTSGGYPILDLACMRERQIACGWLRPGGVRDIGLGTRPNVFGSRAARTVSGGLFFPSRSDAWGYLKFFASRGGRAYPFWLFDPAERWDGVTATNATTLTLPAIGHVDDWATREHVAVLRENGTREVVAIDSVSRSGGVDTVTLGSALGGTDITYAHTARLCRFDSDAITETWITPELCRVDFTAVELPDEATVTQAVAVVATVALTETFDQENCDAAAQDGGGTTDPGGGTDPAPCSIDHASLTATYAGAVSQTPLVGDSPMSVTLSKGVSGGQYSGSGSTFPNSMTLAHITNGLSLGLSANCGWDMTVSGDAGGGDA